MNICTSLQVYASLSRDERLRTYLVEDEAALVASHDNDEPLVDLRARDKDGILSYDTSLPNSLFRAGAAEKLLNAGRALLEKGIRVHVLETYRPYEKQKREFLQISDEIAAQNPLLSGKDLWRKITEFIADPDMCPPHITGGATDILLIRVSDGSVVDMGTELNSVDVKSYLLSDDISEDAKTNRKTLLDAMLAEGFAPMPTEWWHYSYGDKYWGAFYSCDAIYETLKNVKS